MEVLSQQIILLQNSALFLSSCKIKLANSWRYMYIHMLFIRGLLWLSFVKTQFKELFLFLTVEIKNYVVL